MLFVKMDGSPAVGPRVGLVPATDVFLFDGNPPGGTCGRVSRRSRMEAHLGSLSCFVQKIRFCPPLVPTRFSSLYLVFSLYLVSISLTYYLLIIRPNGGGASAPVLAFPSDAQTSNAGPVSSRLS